MRVFHRRTVFGVELYGHEPRVGRYFHYVHKTCFGIAAGGFHSGFIQRFDIIGTEFVTVTVALHYTVRTIDRIRSGIFFDRTLPCPKAHRTSFVGNVFLRFHKVYDRIRSFRVYFFGVSILKAKYIPGKFDHGHLHSKADAEERYAVFAGIFGGGYLAFYASFTEARSDKYTVNVLEQ